MFSFFSETESVNIGLAYVGTKLNNISCSRAVMRTLAKVHSQETYKTALEKYGFDKAPDISEKIKPLGDFDWSNLIDEETTRWY